jgi:hypothetical protein
MWRAIPGMTTVLGVAAMALLGAVAPPAQAAAPTAATSTRAGVTAAPAPALPKNVVRECPAPKPGHAACQALRRTDVPAVKGLIGKSPKLARLSASTVSAVGATPAGFGAEDLQSAYNLSATGGTGQTVAVVDPFDDPNAEADMSIYRAQYGLPACTTANGCFSKVNQRGATTYPATNTAWAGEISLDLDMISATAPNAHILLVEADNSDLADLGASVNEAVALGAKFVSNSFAVGEVSTDPKSFDPFYNHPGVAIVASSGDTGFGVDYPAAAPHVTAVGGTSLTRAAGTARGWSESVWQNGPGSGCSLYEPKPSFQTDTGCAMRTVTDVSADADPLTGVSVYQTFGAGGWSVIGGTSASAPIITGVYASAGTPVAGTYPNSYPYASGGVGLNDVTSGSSGTCSPSYLCTAGPGYDGPSGLGTPEGTAAFRSGPHGDVTGTITNATTGAPVSGATVTIGTTAGHTDGNGSYSLRITPGTYTVSVNAFGYTNAAPTSVTIASGAALTESFTLSPVPMQTLSGTVTDGSGHGWPLYAKIDIDGVPGGAVWTNPYTGAYSVSLPAGQSYSVHVSSYSIGYLTTSGSVSLGSSPVTQNFSLPVDPFAPTTAGYSKADVGTTQTFDSTTAPPAGWSVINASGTTGGWVFNNPRSIGNTTGGTGSFAAANSEFVTLDSSLISPVYNLSQDALPVMSFRTQYKKSGAPSTASLDVSTDGGQTWTSLYAPTASFTGLVSVNVQAYAHDPQVQFRFHYTGTNALWWEVDNVFVGNHVVSVLPGGLVVGAVTNAGTGAGLNLAAVSDTSASTTSFTTPDDPGFGDGFYRIFAPSGTQAITATLSGYTTLTQNVTVAPDSVTRELLPMTPTG